MKIIILFFLGFFISFSASRRLLYTNVWIVKTVEGDEFAKEIAQEHGYLYLGLVESYTDHYAFKKEDVPDKSKLKRTDLTKDLMKLEKVLWAGQQKLKPISLDPRSPRDQDKSNSRKRKRKFRAYGDEGSSSVQRISGFPTTPSNGYFTYQGPTKSIILYYKKKSLYRYEYNDDYWRYQWYVHDYRQVNGPVMDHNVVPVHRSRDQWGVPITGSGVTIAIVDAAVDATHPDLSGQLISHLSHDFLRSRPGFQEGEEHGTNAAGVVAMKPNNKVCGVGIAYGAKIASLKVFDKTAESTDTTFGSALGHRLDSIDIYSNSNNADTDGMYLDEANHMMVESIRRGVTQGRRGLGSVYVFSAGNLKEVDDNCAFDGIDNEPHVILVGAATNQGKTTPYSSACAHVFVTGYSGDGNDDDSEDFDGPSEQGVVTTDLNGECTTQFDGTSASVPIVTGIIALVLQTNPRLGYRDIQHLITMSAEVAPLADNPGTWSMNKAGFWVSPDFGFGLMNAENMVNLARTWTNVQPQRRCDGVLHFYPPKQFTSEQPLFAARMETDVCANTQHEIKFLEKVVLTLNIRYPGPRNDLHITLISPQGTKVQMVVPRPKDKSKSGLRNWSVTSAHTWGENPKGKWTLVVQIKHIKFSPEYEAESSRTAGKRPKKSSSSSSTVTRMFMGLVDDFNLTWYGLAERPQHLANGPRSNYAGFRVQSRQD